MQQTLAFSFYRCPEIPCLSSVLQMWMLPCSCPSLIFYPLEPWKRCSTPLGKISVQSVPLLSDGELLAWAVTPGCWSLQKAVIVPLCTCAVTWTRALKCQGLIYSNCWYLLGEYSAHKFKKTLVLLFVQYSDMTRNPECHKPKLSWELPVLCDYYVQPVNLLHARPDFPRYQW